MENINIVVELIFKLMDIKSKLELIRESNERIFKLLENNNPKEEENGQIFNK